LIDLEQIESLNKSGERLIAFSGLATPILASALEFGGQINSVRHPTFHFLFQIVEDASLQLYLLFLVTFIIGKFRGRKGERVVWETLQGQIDSLQYIAFPKHSDDLNDHHRVTLFKHKKWCWKRFFNRRTFNQAWQGEWKPWGGWLVPVIRSGHTGKGTSTVFYAPDEGKHSEGIAGRCWASDSTVFKEKLPRVIRSTAERNRKKYANMSYMPKWMLENYCDTGRPLARSILTYPVQTSAGNRWGVLVFDSMESSGISEEDSQKAFEVIVEPIGVLLEAV